MRRDEIQRYALSTRSIGFNTIHTDMQPSENGSFVTYDNHMLEVRHYEEQIEASKAVVKFFKERSVKLAEEVARLSDGVQTQAGLVYQRVELIRKLVAIIDEELLPNAAGLPIKNLARLNDTLMAARELLKPVGE